MWHGYRFETPYLASNAIRIAAYLASNAIRIMELAACKGVSSIQDSVSMNDL